MAKKERAPKRADAAKPKKLRKKLRDAEAHLAKARGKRDRAQARVEALSIIADEIRAQLAETEKAATANEATTKRPTSKPALATTKSASVAKRKPARAKAPAVSNKPPAAKAPSTKPKAVRAKPKAVPAKPKAVPAKPKLATSSRGATKPAVLADLGDRNA